MMVSVISAYKTLLKLVLKLLGMKPQIVEIEAGTFMNFWVPIKPSKPAVLFLHGFALDGILSWQFQVLALARTYDVYVPDFMFFGQSTTDKSERSTEFQAECVARGLKKMGVRKCILVGLSYGGMVGFKMAGMYPELIHSMVMTGTVTALTESISSSSLERIGFSCWPDLLLPKSIHGLRAFIEISNYKAPPFPNWLLKQVLEMFLENRKEKVELLEALVVSDNDFKLPHYKQKIYFLTGEDDKIFDVNTVNHVTSQLGECAKLQYVEKAGHVLSVDRPFLYNKLLKEILAQFAQDF